MSSLLFLTSDDFFIKKSEETGNPLLCHGIRGFSLILFYSTYCKYCKDYISIFKGLPGSISGCQVGIINVSTNKKCVDESKQTVAPITYVPYIVLYFDGKPCMIYNGPSDAQEIGKFVIEIAESFNKKQQFTDQGKIKQEGNGIPAYSLGMPVKGTLKDSVCYLEYMEAYTKKK